MSIEFWMLLGEYHHENPRPNTPQRAEPAMHLVTRRCLLTRWWLGMLLLASGVGCDKNRNSVTIKEANIGATQPQGSVNESRANKSKFVSETVESRVAPIASAEQLLEMRLPIEKTREGWIRLFDGRTLIGWQATDNVDWQVTRTAVEATKGEVALLGTTSKWSDYELTLEFNIDADTNSGIFLRTPLFGTDPKTNCYEFNFAPADNPFPTGSIVGRQRIEPSEVGELAPGEWHKLRLTIESGHITASINDKQILDWTDPNEPLPPNLIGLQHNSGRAAFRDIRLRPLGLKPMLDGADLPGWKRYPELGGKFEVEDDILHITGGSGQLESIESWSDFNLLAEVKINAPKLNGGLFFRCVPGETMNGYECQISNETIEGNALMPADCGTGGIFRRLNARIVAADDEQWNTVFMHVLGPQISTWVNGLQVVDWIDTRKPDPNPRKGLRIEAGTIILQAHDMTTDYSFKQISIAPL